MIKNISQICALAGIVLISAIFVPISEIGFELPKLVILSITTCFALIWLLCQPRSIALLLGNTSGILTTCFILFLGLTLCWSIAPQLSLVGAAPRYQGIMTHFCLFVVALFSAATVQTQRGQRLIGTTILISLAVVTFYGILQVVHLDPLAPIWSSDAFLGRIFSTIGHPNMLGQCLLLTITFGICAVTKTSRSIKQYLLLALLVGSVMCLLATSSRSALLGAMVLLVLLMKRQIPMIKKRHIPPIVFALIACVVLGLLFFQERFALDFESGRSTGARTVIWNAAVEMIQTRPQGYGLETMGLTSPQVIGSDIFTFESLTVTVDRAHNIVLDLLHSVGIIGALLYVALIAVLIISSMRNKQEASELRSAATIGLLGYHIALLFGFSSIATAAMSWVMIGIVIGLLPRRAVPIRTTLERWLITVMLGISVVCTCTSVLWFHAAVLASRSAYNESIITFPYDRSLLMQAAEVHLASYDPIIDERIQTYINLQKSLTSGRDGHVYMLQSWLEAKRGNNQLLITNLQTAQELMPTSIVLHRVAMHIADILEDEELKNHHRQDLIDLLPQGYFDENSDMHRILNKQHPWLTSVNN